MCFGEKHLVTRGDEVRAVVCDACYALMPAGTIIENVNVPERTPCATEAYPGAWCCFCSYPKEL